MTGFAEFSNKEELFKYLKDNLPKLKAEKRASLKQADALDFVSVKTLEGKDFATKSEDVISETVSEGQIRVKVAINTTNFIDSHRDLHLPSMWKKSLSETKAGVHLKSHMRDFEYVIADGEDCKVYTKMMAWRDLGYDYEGKTQVLIQESVVKAARNPLMFDQYKNGWVSQHSVGMRYVDLFMCINSEEKYYAEEKANWDKYITEAVNPEVAEEYGYFWAVTTAKYVEGSAVVFGSNSATPTLSVKTSEPESTPETEPQTTQKDTGGRESTIDIEKIANLFLNKN